MTSLKLHLYSDLAPWWPLMSAPADYEEEAGLYSDALDAVVNGGVRELLELGSGGGHNASHLKKRFNLTLVDLSPSMLEVSRELNPECEHLQGDMRSVRLARSFDAVLIHDAIMYMTTREELAAALATAFHHTRPGGAALFVPDDTLETFRPATSTGGHDGGGRSMRYLEWSRAPERGATSFRCTIVYVMLEGAAPPQVVHDEHLLGLFPRVTWLEAIREVGFEARALPYRHSTFTSDKEMFLGLRRPIS